ncbi:MAG: FliA/WhiG family RNA polymerase sigma factor [Vicinamibacterales bacterium]
MRLMTPPPDLETRDRLVMEHVGLVRALAGRLAHRVPSQVEVSELISVGVLGLIDAASRFKPSLGVPFDAFARRRIHGAMLDALRDLDWAPRSVRKMGRTMDGTIARLRHELGREPEEKEIAGALNVSETEYGRILDQLKTAELAVIRQSTTEDGTSSLEVAVDPGEGPYQRLEKQELRELLAEAITELPERERHILALYYHEELTLAEIGEVIGVGESRVSQLRTQAIGRLRSRLAARMQQPRGVTA